MKREHSALDRARIAYEPTLPPLLDRPPARLRWAAAPAAPGDGDAEIRERFPVTRDRPPLTLEGGDGIPDAGPLRVGVVLSGGQAPGGHNVITGLFDGIRAVDAGSRLFGFLGGPRGILRGDHRVLDVEELRDYRNLGGFDLIGSGRDKIDSPEHCEASRKTCRELGLDALVVIGGDDSNTNAALLAEYFASRDEKTCVLGAPKTIDGDLKGGGVEASFGFDTATRVYASLVGNIARDAASAGKYWHFIRLMGRSASHVTLECALATRPDAALIGEEAERAGWTLDEIVADLARGIAARAESGRRYGTCLVPEGLIEFVPEMRSLIAELNRLLADAGAGAVPGGLTSASRRVFASLPEPIREQLLLDRDSHGNVQVSLIETEKLLVEKVAAALPGGLKAQCHFFGYEGRCANPSLFDADYTYALGRTAALLAAARASGYLCALSRLAEPVARWIPRAVPLTSLMRMEERKGRRVPVIGKALVDLDGAPFRRFAAERNAWTEDVYRFPGAIQYFGPDDVSRRPTRTLLLEQGRVG